MSVKCVYIAVCKKNGKMYVGKSKGSFRLRQLWHLRMSKRGSHLTFHRALKKHGAGAFDWYEVFHTDCNVQVCEAEKAYIKVYGTRSPKGYNLTDGGDGGATITGWKLAPFTEEHRRRLSQAHKGKVLSDEHRRKLSRVRTGKRRGPPSAKAREAISRSLIGRKLSEEHKAKLAKAGTGKKQSEETKRKKSASLLRHYSINSPKPLTRAHKKALLEAARRKKSKEHKENISKALKLYYARKKGGGG